jgi:hypothetical protein
VSAKHQGAARAYEWYARRQKARSAGWPETAVSRAPSNRDGSVATMRARTVASRRPSVAQQIVLASEYYAMIPLYECTPILARPPESGIVERRNLVVGAAARHRAPAAEKGRAKRDVSRIHRREVARAAGCAGGGHELHGARRSHAVTGQISAKPQPSGHRLVFMARHT